MPRPNILYLHSHDTGRYIQPYGHAVPTPQLQRLAEEGILFRQAFCAAPTCSPSRASLLTGQCAHSSGMLGLAHRGFSLHDYNQHLLHTLHQMGYYAALAGVQHLTREPARLGYDQIIPLSPGPAKNSAAVVAPAAANFLRNKPAQPFFLSVGFFETHREFPQPEPEQHAAEDDRYCLPPPGLPDTPETRRDMASFKASARLLDQGVGIVLEALAESGLADNTLVICTTDHGLAFPGMKCNLTDHGIGVMLIMRGPGGFSGGPVCEALVSQIDLFPTLCELLEIDPPAWLQGKSLMPLIRGDAEQVNEAIFAEVTYHAAYEPQRAVRTQRYKYIRRFDPQPGPVLPNCDDSPSKEVWLRHGWQKQPVAAEQLYDLAFDPQERRNLVEEPSLQKVRQELRQRLERWMQATADPLLQGPVPAPFGAKVNDSAGLSPNEPVQVV